MSRANLAMRGPLSFRSVNRSDQPGHDPGLQRHHLLPRQLLGRRCFGHLFERVGAHRIGFDDFRSNGLLLPASDTAAIRLGLPLHRGPHHHYNALVIERVGRIEATWSKAAPASPHAALEEAYMRLSLLQGALRRRLLEQGRRKLSLNRNDPAIRNAEDFADLDAMAEALWKATG